MKKLIAVMLFIVSVDSYAETIKEGQGFIIKLNQQSISWSETFLLYENSLYETSKVFTPPNNPFCMITDSTNNNLYIDTCSSSSTNLSRRFSYDGNNITSDANVTKCLTKVQQYSYSDLKYSECLDIGLKAG